MAGRERVDVEKKAEVVGPFHVRATLVAKELERRVVHDYFLCEQVVIEMEQLWEGGSPKAVFRRRLGEDDVGELDDLEGVLSQLKDYAFDGVQLQVTEGFEVSVEHFEEMNQSLE